MPVKHELQTSSASPNLHRISLTKNQEVQSKRLTSHPSYHELQLNHALRSRVLMCIFFLLLIGILSRLFFWQIISRDSLQAQGLGQYTRVVPLSGERGKIYSSDNYLLVGNADVYRLYAEPYLMKSDPQVIAAQLAPLLMDQANSLPAQPSSVTVNTNNSPSSLADLRTSIVSKLSDSQSHYTVLKTKVSATTKAQIEQLKISGLGFESYQIRDYPEASMAAQVLGFVGKDKDGNDQGYFGIEGSVDRELRGRIENQTLLKDALGFSLLFGNKPNAAQYDGRDIHLTIRRDIQYTVEQMLREGIKTYQAAAGEVIVMDPQTGKVLAMADLPNYNPADFYDYPTQLYKNPALVDTFEPGSIFKVLTVSAGVDAGVINEFTQCPDCAGPRKIDKYTIKTWNEVYNPNITMTDALTKSDNVAMVWVSQLLGVDRFVSYVKKFGIGDPTDLELQEDTSTPIRKDWKVIDLATGSFGQGIVTTGMQMLKAIGAVANHGQMMTPQIIDYVTDPNTGEKLPVEPQPLDQVISATSAATVTRMMVNSANNGESKWTVSKTHNTAAKTGTAQIPIDGHYDPTNTTASYIGFAPPDNPKFVMFVKLSSPKSSPWAAETAAPLWYHIADKLFLLLNIPPDK